jgi:hypothetical protein
LSGSPRTTSTSGDALRLSIADDQRPRAGGVTGMVLALGLSVELLFLGFAATSERCSASLPGDRGVADGSP